MKGETVKQVWMTELPECDVCRHRGLTATNAAYDAMTKDGPWAYMCTPHFDELGVGLGEGLGQMIVVGVRGGTS